ncbi:zinc finger protein 518A [Phyllobates terribilis]|uniref:zinc finger protein 518A n=1 Tax=Phyllobates terribilis TaxID=111132 RepID=UPI003CCB2FE5
MRSPNKDFFMDNEGSASSRDAPWDFSRDAFASGEQSTLSSSFSVNERIMHGMGENLSQEEGALSDMAEMASQSPCKKQTARKSFAKGNLNDLDEENTEIKTEPNLDDDSANIAAKVLHFFCQKCKNGIRYSPNDLQKHFLICHNGELPLYPCEMCSFTANDFQEFKQHRKTHRSALVKCEICNNNFLYTLLGLTKHFTVMHCVNGHFNCSKCRFSTRDVGTFVQHIHRHNGIEFACQKCNHISYSKIEFQRHLQGHSTILPFSCQYCSYSAMRKDFIVKHILARHREHIHTKDDLGQDSSKAHMAQANPGLKLVMKRYPPESQDNSPWRHDGSNPVLEKVGDGNDNTSRFQHKFADKNQHPNLPRYNTESAQTVNDGNPNVTTIQCNKEDSITQGNMGLLQNAVHGPTVLMVKNNKITVPANYTATFVGYKMVNGKQNLVIKLLPTNKQAANTTQPSPQSSNSLPHFPQGPMHGSYGASSNTKDNRSMPSYKPPSIPASSPVAPVEKQPGSLRNLTTALGSLMARKNESMSKLTPTASRQQYHEPIHKNVNIVNKANSSSASEFGQKIKEEPAEYNINEQQFFDTDHTYESSSDRIHPSAGAARLSIDPTTGFLVRPQQNNEVGGPKTSKSFYVGKNFNPMLRASAPGGLGIFPGTSPNYISKNDFPVRNAQMNDRMPRATETNKPENVSFMPRITSVFSLQNRPSDPKPVVKNTYLHNMLQDNKRLNDKIGMVTSQSPHPVGNAFAFPKQPLSSPVQPLSSPLQPLSSPIPKFDNRQQNGNTPSSVFLKQEPVSPGSSVRPPQPTRVSELLKTHSDAIVNQQLAKDKMICMAKPASGPVPFQLYHNSQLSGMPQANPVLYPSGSNRFVLPIVPTNQSGLKIISSQTNASSAATFSTGNRFNTPVMVNTKPGMVLTIANGPFGTIRNVSNGNQQQMIGTVNNLGKMALPRLQRPTVPHGFKPIASASSNNIPTNIVSGPAVGGKLPINLNVLQYCLNSDASRTQAHGLEANKQPDSLQKQPVYAILPDGKQAVLLNYVLPKNLSTNTQKPVQFNRIGQKLLPKKPDDGQLPAFLKSRNEINVPPSASIKEEDLSALNEYGGKTPANKVNNSNSLQGKPIENRLCLRSSSSTAQADEPFHSASDDNSVSQPSSSGSSKLSKLRYKQSNMNNLSSKNKVCKRKTSDSGSYEADTEFKTKKRVVDVLVDVPRKQMLHRKCKAKSYASEVDVESIPEDPLPTISKEIVRTLRLYPLNANQPVKYPRRDQPVVVLNHPDADVPEVVNLMRTISKFNGHVLKVSLSKRTLEALLESELLSSVDGLTGRRHRRGKPVSPVKERFVLKLTLKKTSKNNYKIVKNTPPSNLQAKFNCWFCGRIFDNQDEWVGHGQRHLMEATKDWNKLF